MSDMFTPCPILADLHLASQQYRRLLKRIQRDLKHCANCQRTVCPGRTIVADALSQASRDLLKELTSNDPR